MNKFNEEYWKKLDGKDDLHNQPKDNPKNVEPNGGNNIIIYIIIGLIILYGIGKSDKKSNKKHIPPKQNENRLNPAKQLNIQAKYEIIVEEAYVFQMKNGKLIRTNFTFSHGDIINTKGINGNYALLDNPTYEGETFYDLLISLEDIEKIE